MASRKDVLTDIRRVRNTLFRWDWPFFSAREKLRYRCTEITRVAKKYHGMTFDSSDLVDPLYPNETGHLVGVIPTENNGGEIWSLTGSHKALGTVSTMKDIPQIIEDLRTCTGAQHWTVIHDFRINKT